MSVSAGGSRWEKGGAFNCTYVLICTVCQNGLTHVSMKFELLINIYILIYYIVENPFFVSVLFHSLAF